MTSNKRKLLNFNPKWNVTYLCKYVDGESQCLVCEKSVVCKVFNIKRHYELHRSEYDKYVGEERKSIYKVLSLNEEPDSIAESEDYVVGAKRASYEIALNLVRENRAFSDGELVKSCILKAVGILSPSELSKYEGMCLSRRTISRRVDEMAEITESQLKERIKSFTAISLAIDESTDISDIAQLAIFIRGVDAHLNICEELLDIIPMKGRTTGEDLFQCVNECAERMGVSWRKVVSVATDGAKSMSGSKSGLIARIRQKLVTENIPNNLIAIHCFIHQEALCAKSFSLQNVMTVVVKCVNLLRAHGLNHRQFRDFLEFCESEHTDIPYYSEIRWLSRGATLNRFFELRKYVYVFLEEKGKCFPELVDAEWICDLAFITDVTQHLNALSSSLMGRQQLIFNMNDEIEAFKKKISLWMRQLKEKCFDFFPCLQTLTESQDVDVTKYVAELENLEKKFQERFVELRTIKPKLDMFATPFDFDSFEAPRHLQMELIDLQCDTRIKGDYRESTFIAEFYQKICYQKYSNLRKFAAEIIAMFGSTYSCEQFFSLVKLNKCRLRNRLSDTNLRNILRLAAAQEVSPNIEILTKKTIINFNILYMYLSFILLSKHYFTSYERLSFENSLF